MKNLTSKQELFCQKVASGKTQSEAYRIAYSAENMKNETIWSMASKLMNCHKVATRLKEIREPVVEATQLTLETHLKDLLEIRELAKKDMKWSAAVAAELGRGKAAGLHVDKIDFHEDKELVVNIVEFGNEDKIIREHSRTKFRD